jgi:hypothetical protein
MSTNDKTGDQLANTIRKAKSGTPASPTASPSTATEKPAASATNAPAAKKVAPAKKKASRPAAKKAAKAAPKASSIQLGKRVWPD